MKKPEWSDEQLEQMLSKMPQIRDSRNPHEIYRNISLKGNNKKKNRWILPSFAMAAVALLLFLLVPSLMNDNLVNMSGEKYSVDRGSEPEAVKAKAKQDDATNQIMEFNQDKDAKSEARIADYSDAQQEYVVRHLEEDEVLLTYGVTLDYVTFPTVVSLVVKSEGSNLVEQLEEYVPQFNELVQKNTNWGIDEFPTDYFANFSEVIDQDGVKVVRVDIADEIYPESFASAQMTQFGTALNSFRYLLENFDHIELYRDGKYGIPNGDWKVENSINIEKESHKAFLYFLREGSNHKILVPTFEKLENITEALEEMKKSYVNGDFKLNSTIPNSISVKEVNPVGDNLEITFETNAKLENNDTCILMLDAIMMTAKDFGYKTVTFKGAIDQIGDITFGKPEPVPLAPNPIKIN